MNLDSPLQLSSDRDSDSTLGAVLESIKRTTRAALYARVSADKQRLEGTIESQVAELKRQVAAAGHVLVKEYIDDGYSGAEMDRPGLEQLRKDVKTDIFDTIYFLCADRIAREVAYQTIIVDELLKHGKQVIINAKDYVRNPENKLTLAFGADDPVKLGLVASLARPGGNATGVNACEAPAVGAGGGRPLDLLDVCERTARPHRHIPLA